MTSTTTNRSAQDVLAISQGVFDMVFGAWPIAHLPSFEVVTGPKVDGWLVKAVGSLLTVVGGVLLAAGAKRRVTPELRALAMGKGLALATIDFVYVSRKRIPRVYLLDAALHLGFVGAWAILGAPVVAPDAPVVAKEPSVAP